MIILYRNKEDPYADRIAEQLEELVVAHKVIVKEENGSKKYNLPYLQEGETIVDGKNKIEQFLKELSSELSHQRSITGDSCYVDPETGSMY